MSISNVRTCVPAYHTGKDLSLSYRDRLVSPYCHCSNAGPCPTSPALLICLIFNFFQVCEKSHREPQTRLVLSQP